jgi:hypothetical protein
MPVLGTAHCETEPPAVAWPAWCDEYQWCLTPRDDDDLWAIDPPGGPDPTDHEPPSVPSDADWADYTAWSRRLEDEQDRRLDEIAACEARQARETARRVAADFERFMQALDRR